MNSRQHEYFKYIYEYAQFMYTTFTTNDVIKNITGVLVGVSLCIGIISMSVVFGFLNMGLYLYALRELTRYYSDKSHNVQPFLEIVLLFTTLYGLELFHNFAHYFVAFTGLPFVSLVVNIATLYYLTTLVSDTNTYMISRPASAKLSIKDFNFSDESKGTFIQSVLNHVGFATKLYTINNIIIDTTVNTTTTGCVGMFGWIEHSVLFATKLVHTSYSKLLEIAMNVKNGKSVVQPPASVELVETITDLKKEL